MSDFQYPEVNLNFYNGNRFYIFGEIDESIPERIISPLAAKIDELSKFRSVSPIEIHISSDGGNAYYALDIISLFDIAKSYGIKIITIVTSNAGSAASLIAVCGHHRVASQYASYMMHFGKQWDFSHNPIMAERNLENKKFMDNNIVSIYEKNTKLENIPDLILADGYTINGGKNLKKLGLIDEII
jgi:ATP-dependent protease ClpP protease subunit